MKKSITILLLTLFCLSSEYNKVCATENEKVVKILAIGNSFSVDALEQHFYDLAKAEGKTVVVGNLFIGGCSLQRHLDNAINDKPAYSYRKICSDGQFVITNEVKLSTALTDELWDYISFQQQSGRSGLYDTWEESLPELIKYVKLRVSDDAVMMIHQTWAYDPTSNQGGFKNYNNDQMVMYNSIMSAVKKISRKTGIKVVVPCGSAIQNARTTMLKDSITRDGYHLHKTFGRYVAACTWFEKIFKQSVVGNTYMPEGMSESQCFAAQRSAHKAIRRPYKVSKIK